MENTPLIAVLDDYEVCRKLDKITINTCKDWNLFLQKENHLQIILINNISDSQYKEAIQQVQNYLLSQSNQKQSYEEKEIQYEYLNLTRNSQDKQNMILQTGRLHNIIYEDENQLLQFQQIKKYLNLSIKQKVLYYQNQQTEDIINQIKIIVKDYKIFSEFQIVRLLNILHIEKEIGYLNKKQQAEKPQIILILGFIKLINSSKDGKYAKGYTNDIISKFMKYCYQRDNVVFFSQEKDEWNKENIMEGKNIYETNFDYFINLIPQVNPLQIEINFENGYHDKNYKIDIYDN